MPTGSVISSIYGRHLFFAADSARVKRSHLCKYKIHALMCSFAARLTKASNRYKILTPANLNYNSCLSVVVAI